LKPGAEQIVNARITVLGGGAMGTACSLLLAEHPDQSVTLWAREPDVVASVMRDHVNRRYLPDVSLPSGIVATDDLAKATADRDFFVVAVPSKFLRSTLESFAPYLSAPRPMISVVKGVEASTLMRPSQIITDVLGPRDVVVLSGPSHAEEIGRRKPASVVAASANAALARTVQAMFHTDRFRVYTNADVVGVELCGALKNVIAIAAGICDGLGYGDNAKSALITRGLVEMARFGAACGADPTTFSGLAGVGDLITTCISPYGRNRHVGERLGRGESIDSIVGSMEAVAEGVTTTKGVVELARRKRIEMPIASQVYAVLFEGKSPQQATDALMSRSPREE
jgi:glycerol-3-phosphate dehydrogenase (NAD(P)+)